MRLYEIDIPEIDLEQAKTIITQNCQEFLGYANQAKKWLYRGIGVTRDGSYLTGQAAFVADTPEHRSPLTNRYWVQNLVDNRLKELGFTALRGNSIFTTSSYTLANEFGRLRMIFPFDGFSFTWAEGDVDVLYPDVYDEKGHLQTDFINFPDFAWMRWYFKRIKQAFEMPRHYPLMFHNMQAEIEKNYSEFVQNASSKLLSHYVKVSACYTLFSEAVKLYKESVKNGYVTPKFTPRQLDHIDRIVADKANSVDPNTITDHIIDLFSFSNKDFPKALASGHEIAIHGKYLAVSELFIPSIKIAFGDR